MTQCPRGKGKSPGHRSQRQKLLAHTVFCQGPFQPRVLSMGPSFNTWNVLGTGDTVVTKNIVYQWGGGQRGINV